MITDPYNCLRAGANLIPEVTTCGPDTCPIPEVRGACCLGEGRCEDSTRNACEAAEGLYKGDGSRCATPYICSPPPAIGACCTNGSCTITSASSCGTNLGSYQGDGVDCSSERCSAGGPWDPRPPGGGGDCGYRGCSDEPRGGVDLQFTGDCVGEEGQRGLNANGSTDVENLAYGPAVGCSDCSRGLGLALLRGLRNRMFLSSVGVDLVTMYYHHGTEAKAILQENPSLRALVGTRINDFMPGVRTYLYNDVNGEDFVLDTSRIAQIREVVDGIKAHASPELEQDLDRVMATVNAQSGKTIRTAISNVLQVGLVKVEIVTEEQ